MESFDRFKNIMSSINFELPVVFGVITIIMTFIIEIVLLKKGYFKFDTKKNKMEKAIKLNHVVQAYRISKYDDDLTGFDVNSWYHAKYKYKINDKEYTYKYLSKKNPPMTLDLYYINNYNKVFHYEEKKSSVFSIIFYIIPVVLGIIVMNLLGYK